MRKLNRFIPLFAIAALLVYTLLPFAAIYQVPLTQNTAKMASLFGDKVLLCTSDGFRLVSWDDIASGKFKQKEHKRYQCPLCQVAAQAHYTAPADINSALTSITVSRIVFSASASSHIYDEKGWPPQQPRAPPVFS